MKTYVYKSIIVFEFLKGDSQVFYKGNKLTGLGSNVWSRDYKRSKIITKNSLDVS